MIYIAALSSAANAHPSFKQRGVPGLTAVRPCDISIQGLAHAKELAYGGYKDNIDIFISATSRQHKLLTSAPGARLNLDRPRIPMEVPPVCYIPKMQLSSDQFDALMKKFVAMEPSKKKSGNTMTILLEKADPMYAERLLTSAVERIRPDPSYITPTAFLALTYLNSIASEFLSTQTYPAWKSETDGREDEDICKQMEFQLHIRSAKRIVAGGESASKKARTTNDDDEDMEDEDEEMPAGEVQYELKWDSIRDSVYTAKPSPLPFTFNFGGPGEVPFLPGRVFPYFDRMLIPDNLTLRDIVSTHFLRCLGDSREEQRRTFLEMKSGLSQLTRTKLGSEYLHIFIGIKLAIDTQTRLFLVKVADEYAGFCLLGAQFSVLVDNVWYEAESAESLRENVLQLSSHVSALNGLCELMGKLQLTGPNGTKLAAKTIEPSTIQNGHDLWDALERRVLTEDVKADISEMLRNIAFTRSFLPINPANICWALDMIVKNRDEPIPRTHPIFVPDAFNLLSDRTLRVLCCFGPDAFSMQNMSGNRWVVTPLSKKTDPNNELEVGGKGKVLPVIVVAVKGVVACANDMRKTLREKAITLDLKERAARNRCFVFRGKDRDEIYDKLRESVEGPVVETRNVAGGSGTKRSREDDKRIPTSADDLLSLF